MTDQDAPPPGLPPDEPELPWPVPPRADAPPPVGPPGHWRPPAEPWPTPPPPTEPWSARRPAAPWPPEPTHATPRRRRALSLLLAVALIALLAGAAAGIAVTERATSSSGPGLGGLGSGSSSNGGREVIPEFDSSAATALDIDVRRISETVSPAVVNIAATLSNQNQTAGSGVVISESGLVITNNHVINGATDIEVEVGVTEESYSAQVLGYDVEDDIALLKLENASDMKTIKTADSSTVARSDAVVAIGNALGRMGEPSVVAGTVTALHQSITAGDGADRESLDDMIRIAASIQPGDSGGALVNADGRVIGINTAADAGAGKFGYRAGTVGFAIPIEKAMEIANQIRTGDSSNGVHIGDRALLGVLLAGSDEGFGRLDGATVTDVGSGTPAEDAGIEAGDTITAIDGTPVGSGEELRAFLHRYHPGDRVRVTWTDNDGERRRATVTLIKGPPA